MGENVIICPECGRKFNTATNQGTQMQVLKVDCYECQAKKREEVNEWGKYLFENRDKIKKLIEEI